MLNMKASETIFFHKLLLSGIRLIIIFKIRNQLVLLKNKSLYLSNQVPIVHLISIILIDLSYLQDLVCLHFTCGMLLAHAIIWDP